MDLTFNLIGQQSCACSRAQAKPGVMDERDNGTRGVPMSVYSEAPLWESQGIRGEELSAGTLRGRQEKVTVFLLSGFVYTFVHKMETREHCLNFSNQTEWNMTSAGFRPQI